MGSRILLGLRSATQPLAACDALYLEVCPSLLP